MTKRERAVAAVAARTESPMGYVASLADGIPDSVVNRIGEDTLIQMLENLWSDMREVMLKFDYAYTTIRTNNLKFVMDGRSAHWRRPFYRRRAYYALP